MAVVVAFVVLGVSGRAETVRFGFDDPAELGRWEQVSGQLKLKDTWLVEEGVLKISDSGWNSVARIRNLEFHHGIIKYRVRWAAPDDARFEAGAGYRLGRMPFNAEILTAPPGYYVSHYDAELGSPTGGLRWVNRNAPPVQGFAVERAIPIWDGLPFDEWHTVRVEVAGGEHRIFIAIEGESQPFLRVSGREEASYYDSDAEPHYVWAGNDWYRNRPMRQGPGGVGIIFSLEGHPADRGVQIDYFEVTTTLPVEAGGKAATTWGHMKSTAVVR